MTKELTGAKHALSSLIPEPADGFRGVLVEAGVGVEVEEDLLEGVQAVGRTADGTHDLKCGRIVTFVAGELNLPRLVVRT